MTQMIIANHALVVLLALSESAVFGESYLQQAPPVETNPAFVEQLPETSVVPAPRPPADNRKLSHRPRQPPRARPPALLANSIFPSVGSGVTERSAPGPADNRLPTVGSGTVGH
ncbi:hypothetical protein PH552_04010 [Rhizobium sp. CNPSo 3968]|uniref:hypothetical protein n=1 Tax=Rhizobium sp. CNPSo 3968 TaxID=3021408 RepID=UPI000DDEE716|nr:hypothetical protein [Rhizobium sp. CNPSo 3968]MDK4718510.1 hypothetical protein [Rhizobium sp. CNPSo 3968]